LLGTGIDIPLGFRFLNAKYVFNYSSFENFEAQGGYSGGVLMFSGSGTAQVMMTYTNYTNITVKVYE
jgi:hypothetical protein